jgi:hypothetical protein
MKNDLKLFTDELEYLWSNNFPANSKAIADLRTKIEFLRKDMDESIEVIKHIEKLQMIKTVISN